MSNKKTAFDRLLGCEVRKHGLGVGIYDVSPPIAKALLDDPACQISAIEGMRDRGLSESRVDRYAAVMAAGNWALNGEALMFDVAGRRLNGQHRLRAVVKSGVTIRTLVVWNLPTEVFRTHDQGGQRTLADVLHIEGVSSSSLVTATCGWIGRYHAGQMAGRASPFAGGGQELSDWFAARREKLALSVQWAAGVTHGKVPFKLLPTSALAALHYLTVNSTVDHEATARFWESLTQGVGLEAGSNVLTLRNTLANYLTRAKSGRTPDYIKLALVVKAYNRTLEGVMRQAFSYRPGCEPFPEINNCPPVGLDAAF